MKLTFLEFLDELEQTDLLMEASNLGGSVLYKYDWRAAVFLKKFKAGEPFELVNGKTVKFVPDAKIVKAVTAGESTTNLELLSQKGERFKFNQLAKTKEFGGKGEGSGTFKEDRELQSLIDQINDAKAVAKTATIKIRVGSKTYVTYSAASTPGTPKSDFHLIDIDGKELCWISHKDGKSAKDFQQWGGISATGEPTIYAHPETKKFIDDVRKEFPEGLPRATTIYRKIKDQKLKNLSVYGNKWGGPYGRQNVTMLLQGPVRLVRGAGDTYQIKANHEHVNGDVVDAGGYEPVFMAVYKGDRDNFGVKGARFSISPIQSRKGVEFPSKK
jgi:hypothetical protein